MAHQTATYYKTVTQGLVVSGADHVINFDTVGVDASSLVSNPSTNFQFKANAAGIWAIAAKVGVLPNTGTTAIAYVDLFIDIPSYSMPFKQNKSRIKGWASNDIQTILTGGLFYLNLNATVQVKCNAAWAGTAPSIYFDGVFSNFQAVYIGA